MCLSAHRHSCPSSKFLGHLLSWAGRKQILQSVQTWASTAVRGRNSWLLPLERYLLNREFFTEVRGHTFTSLSGLEIKLSVQVWTSHKPGLYLSVNACGWQVAYKDKSSAPTRQSVFGKRRQVFLLHLAEAHIRAASEETFCVLQKPTGFDCVRKNPVLAHVLSQLNPSHMLPFRLLKINFFL